MQKVTASMNDAAERKIDELERELAGTQEMLAFLLMTIGEAVEVPKELIAKGLGEQTEIRVDDDIARDMFVFSLHTPE